ncbi:MAG: hypothetical protein EXS13_03600 [Planctomycetes bacterium]|nr:hypothetical protein [Planctomycetota bacterium]
MQARPADASGTLSLALAIRGDLVPHVSANGRDVRFVDAAGAVVLNYAGLKVFDADGRTLDADFEALSGRLQLAVDDRDAQYPLTIDPVVQQAYLKASNTGAYDNFSVDVAVSSDTVVVAAHHEDSNARGVNGNQSSDRKGDAGAAYVFDLDSASGRREGGLSTYGTGTPGSGGFVPSIELVGSPCIGDDVWLQIRDGLGGAPAFLLIGFGRDNFPYAGGSLLVAITTVFTPTLGGTPGIAGAGMLNVTAAIPDDPAIIGVVFDFQVLVTDAAAVQRVALSNGAELVIGG